MDTAYTGNQIAARRKALGMTQKDLAEKLHVTDKAVSKWERGVNFPDLGLMEALATALETTPSCLLGLEDANRDEVLSTVTQISEQQLEETQRDVKWLGWGCVLAAALLVAVYFLYGKNVRNTQIAYITLTFVILAAAVCGLWLLFKYGQIRKFDLPEIAMFHGIGLAVLIYLGIQFVSGRSPSPAFGACLIAAASVLTQLLFYRMMVPGFAKALPLILTAGFALWRIPREYPLDADVFIFALPTICSLIIWAICCLIDLRTGKVKPPPVKRFVVITAAVILAVCLLFYQPLTQIYVHVFHDHLQNYSDTFLADSPSTSSKQYGLWKVTAYPEDNLVEFHTGGSGLVPNSSYEGFYYSADDVHLPFQGADVSMSIDGEIATWTDGTDNWGRSIRLRKNWFWFEAHF